MTRSKVVFVDWYGTLSNSLFWDQLKDSRHPHSSLLPLLETSLFQTNKNLIDPWMKGEFLSEDVMRTISCDTGIEYDTIFDEFVRSCKNMKIDIDSLQLIQQIRSLGIRVVIATDNMDSFTRWTADSLHLSSYFDDILNSHNLRCLKKEISGSYSPFFSGYLSSLGLRMNDAILFDDSKASEIPLSSLGINYVRIGEGSSLFQSLRNFYQSIIPNGPQKA